MSSRNDGPIHAVIMAGGSGTRFWPASRKQRPKQFLPLCDGVPLIAATVERLRGLCPPERTWIVTNAAQARALPEVLPAFAPAQVIVEPEARDTAPCVALAVATVAARDADATMVVLPADHVIRPVDAFVTMLRRAVDVAQDRRTLVTFGIAPDRPATGYGYIECGDRIDEREPEVRRTVRFREKPDRATAEGFLAAGNFLWNSGIFVWHTDAIRAAMRHGNPELAGATDDMLAAMQRGDAGAVADAFRRAPRTSIDYAVMERAPQVAVVRATVRWDDVGAFTALGAVGRQDARGNIAVLNDGAAQVLCESDANVVYAEGRRTVALFGVRDLVVVAVGDAVMVCPRDRADDLKALVERVRADGRDDLL